MVYVCIVGVGLIGGSLGQALRRVKKNGRRSYFISGLGRSRTKLKLSQKLGAVDRFSTKPSDVIRDADIVVLATPVQVMTSLTRSFLPLMKSGAILTDAGSVKGNVISGIHKILKGRPDVHFVGAHPLAGSEKFGILQARPNLFKDAACAISTDGSSSKSRSVVALLWRDAAAKPIFISSKNHDRLLALTSHLPHLFAFSLINRARHLSLKGLPVKSLTAGSFHDATRVAGSAPELWAGILEMNQSDIRRAVNEVSSEMKKILLKKGKILISLLSEISRAKQTW